MREEPALRYAPEASPFRFRYFEGWTLSEEGGTVSLWRSSEGGAITVSSVAHRDPAHVADALEHCRLFVERNGLDLPRVEGDAAVAEAVFDVPDGGWCKARVIARGPRVVVATYNADRDDRAEEDQADAILVSVEFADA